MGQICSHENCTKSDTRREDARQKTSFGAHIPGTHNPFLNSVLRQIQCCSISVHWWFPFRPFSPLSRFLSYRVYSRSFAVTLSSLHNSVVAMELAVIGPHDRS